MAREVIQKWYFGEATVRSAANADAVWVRGYGQATPQKSATGWMANLYGGLQTGGTSHAAVYIPVDELPPYSLKTDQWTYNLTNAEVFGVNLVIWMHDPTNNTKRVEITQAPSGVSLAKAQGWNGHVLNTATTQFFYYGENVSGSGLSAGTQYTWAEFQADATFKAWTIYMVSLEYGWYSTGTFEDAWVADIEFNGQVVLLKPDSTGTGRIGRRFFTDTSGAINTTETLSPKTPFRLLDVKLHLNSVATQETFTLTCNAGRSSAYDTLLYSKAMSGVTDIIVPFGVGYDFYDNDVIDPAWTNTDSKTYGITYSYQTVFEGS